MNSIIISFGALSVKVFFLLAHGLSLFLIFNLFFVLVFLDLFVKGVRGFLKLKRESLTFSKLQFWKKAQRKQYDNHDKIAEATKVKPLNQPPLYVSWKQD